MMLNPRLDKTEPSRRTALFCPAYHLAAMANRGSRQKPERPSSIALPDYTALSAIQVRVQIMNIGLFAEE